MTVKEANELIGKLVDRHHGACVFQAIITDVKTSYGTDRVLLEPVAGSGSAWANLDGLSPYAECGHPCKCRADVTICGAVESLSDLS